MTASYKLNIYYSWILLDVLQQVGAGAHIGKVALGLIDKEKGRKTRVFRLLAVSRLRTFSASLSLSQNRQV